MKFGAILLLLTLPLSGAPLQPAVELTPRWTTRPELPSVESVRYSPSDHVLYVSNLGRSKSPRAKDGDGSIGRVGLDGFVLQAEWVKGLNAPKGLGLREGRLYVTDIDRVVEIDTATGVVVRAIAIPEAMGLNDLTLDEAGSIYVTDHPAGRVFVVRDGVVSVACDQVAKPNGILAFGPDLLVLAQGTVHRVGPDGRSTVVATGLDVNVDGIEHLRGDDFLVTCSSGVIYSVNLASGDSRVLHDTRGQGAQTADLDFNPATGTIYVPTLFTDQLTAYDVNYAPAAPEPGRAHTVAELGLRMVWIAPGSFTMGSPVTENSHERDERQHHVTLTRGFWLGACEVTVDQWAAFVRATDYSTEAERGDGVTQWVRGQWVRVPGSNWKQPGFAQSGRHPVVGVSWHDAQEFCLWLTARDRAAGLLPAHLAYTLPTEAQWEYACRAGSDEPLMPGSRNLTEEIWYRYGDGVGGILAEPNTQPTGVRRVNAWGLYDIHGNVFEWCQDWYDPELADQAVDPVGPAKGQRRICRGGAWSSYPRSLRAAARGHDDPGNRGTNLGFRLCLVEMR